MVTTPMQPRVNQGTVGRCHGIARPPPDLSVLPAAPVPGWAVGRVLRAETMVAVPLEPGEWVDTGWVERMRGPYTSRARHLLERALAPPAAGQPLAARHDRDSVPIWVREAAARHRGLLDALGLDLPLALDDHADHAGPAGTGGSILVQHLVPAIALGWYLVTTVHATEHAVVLLEGTYAEHESDEAPFPVRWSWCRGAVGDVAP